MIYWFNDKKRYLCMMEEYFACVRLKKKPNNNKKNG